MITATPLSKEQTRQEQIHAGICRLMGLPYDTPFDELIQTLTELSEEETIERNRP